MTYQQAMAILTKRQRGEALTQSEQAMLMTAIRIVASSWGKPG